MDSGIRVAFASLRELVGRNGESLQTEMQELRSETRTGMERVEAATRRNTTVLTSGALAIAGLQRWAQQRDKLDQKRDREIHELRARFQKFERSLKRRAS